MVTTELGACEWFVWDLRRSNLIDRGQLDQIVGEFLQKNPRAEPPALAEFLVEKCILTEFQTQRLLQGKTQGFVLGPFTLMDDIGAGSMGTVYKAQSKTDNQWYAVKVLPRRSMWNVRIARRKVRAFEACRHPAVVPFVDVGTAGGMHYLAWPLVEGESLDKVVTHQGKIAHQQAAQFALQIAEGLDICHHQGLFHGLLKPSNLMIGTDNLMHILDFGIGCLLAETEGESLVDTMSTSNSVTSGLDCASPESIMDPTNLTPAGDQYSLGCVLYYMLTGQYPFPDGSAAEKMMAHQFKDPTPIGELRPEVPAALVAVIERLMRKSPEQRFGSTAELVETLRPLGSAASSFANRQPARPRAPAPPANLLSLPERLAPDRLASERPTPSTTHGIPAVSRPSAAPASPSTPTPRPASIGSLPSRNSLRGAPPALALPVGPNSLAADPPKREEFEECIKSAPAPQADRPTLEEHLGPFGIFISAVAACMLVFLLARMLNLF